MERLRFKQCFHVEVVEPDSVFLLAENSHQVLTGSIYKHLAPLLNGQHTQSEILSLLAGKVSPPDAFYALTQLMAAGYVVEENGSVPAEEAAFWHMLGVDTKTVSERLHQNRVSVRVLGEAQATPLTAALKNLKIQVGDEGELVVVVTDDYLQEDLKTINQQALATGRPWMLVKLIGNLIWIGPIFKPGETACWACMAYRIQGNRQVESFIQKKTKRSAPLKTSLPALESAVNMAANLAATEIVKWLAQGHNKVLEGQLLTFDVLSTETQKHAVVRRPQCPACGDPDYLAAARQRRPIEIASYPKKFTADGGYRTVFPEETFARYQHHISPITGVVSSLTDRTGEINGIAYSYMAGHNFAMPSDDLAMLRMNLRGRSGGKGMTDIQAKVSAIGEAMERYSGVFRGDEIRIRSNYKALEAEAIHLYDCLMFSEKQYAHRQDWNAQRTNNFHLVPNLFDEEQELDWSPLWSLTNREFKYLPTVYCYYGHPELRFFFCGSDANGCAAGNTMEEAILQGFMELIERDGVALWWYNCIRRPMVDVDSFDIPYYQILREYYQQRHRELWVLDLTTDLNIPIFAAVSGRIDKEEEDIIVGFGAHLDARVAILRALSEVNQLLPAVSHTGPDGRTMYFVDDGDTMEWLTKATMEKQSYLTPDKTVPAKTAADYRRYHSSDLKEDVETCIEIMCQAGLEVLALDQTRPDVGLKVCRVVIPGLRHFWRRLGPGRLYDVPVKLGWLNEPIPEEELNSFSLFF